jgi:CIC family chloride channel protein
VVCCPKERCLAACNLSDQAFLSPPWRMQFSAAVPLNPVCDVNSHRQTYAPALRFSSLLDSALAHVASARPPLDFPGFGSIPAYVVLGVLLGFLGVLYNRAMLSAVAFSAKLTMVRVEWHAALIGAAIGTLTWFLPGLAGGDSITQQILSGNAFFSTLVAAFLLRFVSGPVSYAARTPGGLFAPLLTIGSQAGLLFGILWCRWFNPPGLQPREFALVGMAAFFGAVVRAPITGIILIVELTGSSNYFLAMLGATFASVTVATFLKDPPIYDSLRELSD